MAEKDTTKKAPAKRAVAKAPAKKPRAAAKKPEVVEAAPEVDQVVEVAEVTTTVAAPIVVKPSLEEGKYVFATGRRKTSIANVRLFSGKGETNINRKPLSQYFFHSDEQSMVLKPLELTGLKGDFYFNATVNGGGIHSQSRAVQHGLAQALGSLGADVRIVMKKNGFLTRDDRKKERKKPGLRRARRAPQWAKR